MRGRAVCGDRLNRYNGPIISLHLDPCPILTATLLVWGWF